MELHSPKVLFYAFFLEAQHFSQLMDKSPQRGAMSWVPCPCKGMKDDSLKIEFSIENIELILSDLGYG